MEDFCSITMDHSMGMLSVIIPARNEADNIQQTLQGIQQEFDRYEIKYEIIVINDGSQDKTEQVVQQCIEQNACIRLLHNRAFHGVGNAIRRGLDSFQGDYVIIVMADGSDAPKDMVRYYKKLSEEGYDCCFGSRWDKGARVQGYPPFKKFLNRLVNCGIRVLFGLKYCDVTNAFKAYSRETIEGIKPILSRHFNVTVELPLKAIIRGFTYTVVPTDWQARQRGKTQLILKEMGSRYLFIVIYVLIEKWLTRGLWMRSSRNFKKTPAPRRSYRIAPEHDRVYNGSLPPSRRVG